MNPPELPTNPQPQPPPTPPKLNWWLFFGLLFAPGICALAGSAAKLEGLAVGCPLVGGGIAGLVCGIMLARRIRVQSGAQVALGIVFVPLFAFLSFGLGFVGCMVGGYQMNFH